MFRFLLGNKQKALTTILLLKNLQRSRCISCNSTLSKNKSSSTSKNSRKTDKASQEVFFPSLRNQGIKNKIALVTGGTEGIGLRCVTELLNGGATGVMIADTSETKGYESVMTFSREFGRKKVAFIQINPANYELLKNAFVSTINFYKGLDIVINNIRFKEKNWEDQVDETIKRVVLSTQLCLEFMGRNNGGNGGILLNIASNYEENTDSCPLHCAVQDFIVRFDRSVASAHFATTNIKILTICKATFDSVGCDLATIISKGPNGCVWEPS